MLTDTLRHAALLCAFGSLPHRRLVSEVCTLLPSIKIDYEEWEGANCQLASVLAWQLTGQ